VFTANQVEQTLRRETGRKKKEEKFSAFFGRFKLKKMSK
jgi:hypothetical protein